MKTLLVGYKAADLTPELLEGDVTCHVLDIYHRHAIEKVHHAKCVCSAHLPDGPWDLIRFKTGPKLMSGETYWNKYNERPWVLVRLADGMTMPMGSFYVPPQYRQTYWRCDLHARYRPDGRQIAFNSVHEGSRQVYVRDIELAGTCGDRSSRMPVK